MISARNLILCFIALLVLCPASRADEHRIWHRKPAEAFTESTPLGNGRLGAMLFGGISNDHIVLNEEGMWSGSPQDADREDAHEYLPRIRELLFAGKNVEAQKLMQAHFTCAGVGSNRGRSAKFPYGSFQLLANVDIEFDDDTLPSSAKIYRRELDLAKAVCRIQHQLGDAQVVKEAFVSAVDQVFVYRVRSEDKSPFSCRVKLSRPERGETVPVGDNQLHLQGQLDDGKGGQTGVRYSVRLVATTSDGSVAHQDSAIVVSDSTDILILIAGDSDLSTIREHGNEDPAGSTEEQISRALTKSYDKLLTEHVADYQKLYNRVSLSLGGEQDDAVSELSAVERLERQAAGEADPGLAELYFNFGRYLLISSSRPGGLPANLQGIWAEGVQTPWNGDWHTNVNVQMNYWPAENCNLSDLHEPLFRLIESLVAPGEKTAKAYFDARGWVGHVLANPWGYTSPGEDPGWGSTYTCSAWLCQHVWDHYLFSQDKDFLRARYPLLKGSAQFYLDVLVEDPKTGNLVTVPSNSPENAFYTAAGDRAQICVGSTMDLQIIRYLFAATADAARILGVDDSFAAELRAATEKLLPTRIGSDGRILEWDKEYKEVDPTHRHVSHLWGLYPGDEIKPRKTPDLAQAARKSLEARGDEGTGWGLANKIAMWSRLGDGNRAYRLLLNHLRPVGHSRANLPWTGGTYPNMFDAHPPFQIDGNFGGTAAIAEMLLQSSVTSVSDNPTAEIHLMPALPDAWPEGSFQGLRARGGFEIDASWKDGALESVTVHSQRGLPCIVRCGTAERKLELAAGEQIQLRGTLETAAK